jgi:hypothetical protein
VRRWRVRFVPKDRARFSWPAFETVVEHDHYQQAVTLAGLELVKGRDGEAGNRLCWDLTLVQLVEEDGADT